MGYTGGKGPGYAGGGGGGGGGGGNGGTGTKGLHWNAAQSTGGCE